MTEQLSEWKNSVGGNKRSQHGRGHQMKIRGCDVVFPHKPYSPQISMMDQTIHALKSGHNVLLELPTGSGKSLSLICAASAWIKSVEEEMAQAGELEASTKAGSGAEEPAGRGTVQIEAEPSQVGDGGFLSDHQGGEASKDCRSRRPPRVFIASRTHSQIGQLIREMRKTVYRPKMCVLGSREHYCINKEVAASSSKGEDCKERLRNNTCSFFHNVHKLANHKEIAEKGQMEVHDIEDLVGLGKRVKGCPYFTARLLAQTASIIFCPYNYLIDWDPLIREAMDIDLKGAAIILDEAHNVEDVCRQAASMEITHEDLQEAVKQWERMDGAAGASQADACEYMHLEAVTREISDWLTREVPNLRRSSTNTTTSQCVWSGAGAAEVFCSCGITEVTIKTLTSLLGKAIKAAEDQPRGQIPPPAKALTILKTILTKVSMLFANGGDYKLVVQQRTVPGDARGARPRLEVRMCLWCLNPGVAFEALKKDTRAIVLTSGTLSPMTSFASELCTPFAAQLSTSHVVNTKTQVWVGSMQVGPAPKSVLLNGTFKNQDSAPYQDDLGASVLRVCEAVPHGVLCFFPSYSFLDRVVSRWKNTGFLDTIEKMKVVVREPRQGGDGEFDKAMTKYYGAIKSGKKAGGRGALFLAVCRGKVSEGLDFTDDNARAVLVVGIPYPNARDEQVNLKKAYNDERKKTAGLLAGEEWYSQQAFRALNQAVGRCIRHIDDYGAIVLLDYRYYNSARVKNSLSKWVRECVQDYSTLEYAGCLVAQYSYVE